MSENWVKISEKILEQLKKAEITKDKDRLELVRSIRYTLNVLQRSLIGWMHWANNPEIMSIFSQNDLEKMAKELSKFTKSFIKYDIEMTDLGVKKGLKPPKNVAQKNKQRRDKFYV